MSTAGCYRSFEPTVEEIDSLTHKRCPIRHLGIPSSIFLVASARTIRCSGPRPRCAALTKDLSFKDAGRPANHLAYERGLYVISCRAFSRNYRIYL